jgi:hypothetical protein
VTLRCILDDLLLYATFEPMGSLLIVFDGDEGFALEALEACYYELVSATPEEVLELERARYRLLRRAEDFRSESDCAEPQPLMTNSRMTNEQR